MGADNKKTDLSEKNAAVTHDGGKTWTLASKPPSGYRSAVARDTYPSPPVLVAVGINGADASYDGGKIWSSIAREEYNAISFQRSTGWPVGPHGRTTSRHTRLKS